MGICMWWRSGRYSMDIRKCWCSLSTTRIHQRRLVVILYIMWCACVQYVTSIILVNNTGITCCVLIIDSYDPVSLQMSLVVYPVHYRFVHCTGVEKRLIDCEHGDTNVTHQQCVKNGNYKYGVAACTTSDLYIIIILTTVCFFIIYFFLLSRTCGMQWSWCNKDY